MRAALLASIALALTGCGGSDDSKVQPPPAPAPATAPATSAPEEPGRSAMEALIAFARAPSDEAWAAVPLADEVALGLADTLSPPRSRHVLRDPNSWRLAVDAFRGRAGTASALELIASEEGALRITHGPHPHCAAPPVPPPARAAALQRVVVQPSGPDGCLDWWTVDAFVTSEGRIRAVTLDLWEP